MRLETQRQPCHHCDRRAVTANESLKVSSRRKFLSKPRGSFYVTSAANPPDDLMRAVRGSNDSEQRGEKHGVAEKKAVGVILAIRHRNASEQSDAGVMLQETVNNFRRLSPSEHLSRLTHPEQTFV